MEHNDKDKPEAEKEQMNGQTEEALGEMTTPEEPENNSNENAEGTSQSNEEENLKSEEEEEDGLAELNEDAFQSSIEMSGQEYEKDENNRPVCRYNTVCYRKIKRGNTKQRVDEFESMLNV